MGEGVGAYVAACIAGVFSMKDAMTLVAMRAACLDWSGTEPRRAEQALKEFRAAVATTGFCAPKLPLWSDALRRPFGPGEIPAPAIG